MKRWIIFIVCFSFVDFSWSQIANSTLQALLLPLHDLKDGRRNEWLPNMTTFTDDYQIGSLSHWKIISEPSPFLAKISYLSLTFPAAIFGGSAAGTALLFTDPVPCKPSMDTYFSFDLYGTGSWMAIVCFIDLSDGMVVGCDFESTTVHATKDFKFKRIKKLFPFELKDYSIIKIEVIVQNGYVILDNFSYRGSGCLSHDQIAKSHPPRLSMLHWFDKNLSIDLWNNLLTVVYHDMKLFAEYLARLTNEAHLIINEESSKSHVCNVNCFFQKHFCGYYTNIKSVPLINNAKEGSFEAVFKPDEVGFMAFTSPPIDYRSTITPPTRPYQSPTKKMKLIYGGNNNISAERIQLVVCFYTTRNYLYDVGTCHMLNTIREGETSIIIGMPQGTVLFQLIFIQTKSYLSYDEEARCSLRAIEIDDGCAFGNRLNVQGNKKKK